MEIEDLKYITQVQELTDFKIYVTKLLKKFLPLKLYEKFAFLSNKSCLPATASSDLMFFSGFL